MLYRTMNTILDDNIINNRVVQVAEWEAAIVTSALFIAEYWSWHDNGERV